jgi:uncharacterized delta-60 repeat protein
MTFSILSYNTARAALGITGALLAGACGDNGGQATPPDGALPTDAAADGSPPPEVKLTISPLSAAGHDHLFGAVFDAQGSLYATGQIAPGTDTATDYASLVAKFTPAGELDTTFGDRGVAVKNVAVGTNGELFRGIVLQSDGKIVISGTVEHAGAADARDRDIALVRYTTSGQLDTTFGDQGVKILDLSTGVLVGTTFAADSVWGLAVYPDDRLVLSGGKVRTGATDTDYVVVRLTKDGALDTTFAGGTGVFALDREIPDPTNGNALKHNNASPRNITLLPGTQGIIAAGYQPIPGRDTEPVVYKLTDAGALDTSFSDDGVFDPYLLNEQAETYAARLQGDKLVTTGYGRALATETTDILSLRLTSSGALDTTYGTEGMVRIDVGGFADNSRNLAILPDNRVLLAGGGRPTSTNVDGFVAILTPDGKPDTSFSPTGWKTFDLGGPSDFLWSLAVAPGGRTAAFVGFRGAATGGNDDAALLLVPIP